MVQPSKTFGERLVAAGAERGRLCVGIDPHAHLLQAWGLNNDVDGLRTFARTCVEAFADTVAVVKPQVAFFERFGSMRLCSTGRNTPGPTRGRMSHAC